MADNAVPRPPSRGPAGLEFRPVVEPALGDIPDFPGVEPEEYKVLRKGRGEYDLTHEIAATASELALGDRRVSRRLKGHRHSVTGVSLRDGGKDGEERVLVVVIWDYDGRVTIEAELTGAGTELSVRDVRTDDQQPAPSDEEIELAIRIARSDERVARELEDGFEAMAILASAVEAGDLHYGRRRLDLGFGPADERMPRVRALVDLGEERVLAVGCSAGPDLVSGGRDE
jgi:hypothetical protein